MKDEDAPDWLPDLIECDWNRYHQTIEHAYMIFFRDFGNPANRHRFRGKRMGLKRHPELDGKSATFWHFVTEGRTEVNRVPTRERIERIAWPRAILVAVEHHPSRVRVWANERHRPKHAKSARWIVALLDFSNVVVVEERKDYVLPWTAFPVAKDHRRKKLRTEYNAWKNARKG